MTLICPGLNLISMFQNVLQKTQHFETFRKHFENFHGIVIILLS